MTYVIEYRTFSEMDYNNLVNSILLFTIKEKSFFFKNRNS